MNVFLQGVVAGFGIAIPVGPIGVLILERGIRRGFRDASLAGLGAAAADLFYAGVAATAGVIVASALRPILIPMRVVAIAILVLIAAVNLPGAFVRPDPAAVADVSGGRTFLTFLGLTLLNPVTVIYFASLVVGLDLATASGIEKVVFVGGAFLASASWQLFLAAFASFAGARLGPRTRLATSVVGSLVILGFAVKMALSV